MRLRRRAWLSPGLLVAVTVAVAGCGGGAPQSSSGGGGAARSGGTVSAALTNDPATIDLGASFGPAQRAVGEEVFESLFAMNASFEPVPMLAQSYTLSPDGLTYTIKLRPGITFQNGQKMTSADAKASLAHWFRVSGLGPSIAQDVAAMTTPGPLTLVIRLKQPHSSLLSDIAWRYMPIMPAKIAAAAGAKPVTIAQSFGTGPYKVQSYTPGVAMTLVRYAGYKSLTTPSSGFAGAKHAYLDKIVYHFVPNPQQELNGLKTGQYQWLEAVNGDQMSELASDPSIVAQPSAWKTNYVIPLNSGDKNSVFYSLKARQAFNMLVDKQAIATAAFGLKSLWSPMSGALSDAANPLSHSTAGLGIWSQHNPAEARTLFAQAGVTPASTAKKPIVIVSDTSIVAAPAEATIVQGELQSVGLHAKILSVNSNTVAEIFTKPDIWDIFFDSILGDTPSAAMMDEFNGNLGSSCTATQCTGGEGGWPSQAYMNQINGLLGQYESATSAAQSTARLNTLQQTFFNNVPTVMEDTVADLNPHSSSLVIGDTMTYVLWNAYLGKS